MSVLNLKEGEASLDTCEAGIWYLSIKMPENGYYETKEMERWSFHFVEYIQLEFTTREAATAYAALHNYPIKEWPGDY